MRDTKNIEEVGALAPDFMGFILYPPSKRYLGENYMLTANIPENTQRVGVFVNALLEDVIIWTNRLKLNFAQVHGDEPPQYCLELKYMGLSVIKSFGVGENFDFETLKDYLDCCDYFLFDTQCAGHGGSGKQFDWKLLQDYPYEKPFFLSGGIGPEDATAILNMNDLPVYAVDINSRFESAPAVKDTEKLKPFIAQLRNS